MKEFFSSSDISQVASDPKVVKYEDYTFPSGKILRLRNMSGTRRDQWEETTYDVKQVKPGKAEAKIKKSRSFRASVVVYAACDEQFKPIFSEEDIAGIAEWPMDLLEPIFKIASKLNGLGQSEDIEKNSEKGQEDSSASS